jgi:hypothetical protein
VYTVQKALESEHVSNHIGGWIDLVWGEKQRGERAREAMNVYIAEMRDDVCTEERLGDSRAKAEIEAIL